MFADVAGFTAMTEALSQYGKEGAEVLSGIINEVFTPCIKVIYDSGGFITHFQGDSFMAIFPDNINDGIYAAGKITQEIKAQHYKKTKLGEFEISIKVGLSYGNINWGITGSRRKLYYFRGEAVEISSLAENHAEKMDIIADEAIYSKSEKCFQSSEIAPGFYKLFNIEPLCKGSHKISSYDIAGDISGPFLPPSLAGNVQPAELRDIACVFLCLRELEDHDSINIFTDKILAAVDKWGGYFSRLSFGDKGTTGLINFGIPVSYENNIQRALNCILEIQSFCGTGMKAGITFGRLFCGYVGSSIRAGYEVLGNAVNLSARIAMESSWGDIWVCESIHKHAERDYNLEFMGQFEFKGISGENRVFCLQDKKSFSSQRYEGKFYGRQDEKKNIQKYISPVFNGEFSGILYIYGEAGMGKSRLCKEATRKIENRVKICLLQCDSIVRKAWNPFVSFFQDFFEQEINLPAQSREDNFTDRFHAFLSELEALNDRRSDSIISELKRTESVIKALLKLDTENTLYEKLDAKGKYENTLYAVKEFFKGLSLIRPVVINLEDIHWLDPASQDIINHLSRNIESYPMALICTGRYGDDGSKPTVDADKQIKCREIILESLSDTQTMEMIKEKIGAFPDNKLLGFIIDRTSKNPFYMEQFCIYLQEKRYLKLTGDKYTLIKKPEDIPVEINQILIARIDRLSREIRELIKVASVIGREFNPHILISSVEMLLDIEDLNEKAVFDLQAIDAIARSGKYSYIHEGERENIWMKYDEIKYIFRHSLLQESAYDMQLRERLRILHRIVAGAIEKMLTGKDQYIDLAYHFERSGVIDKAKAYLQYSGDYLKSRYKNSEAIDIYYRLLVYTRDEDAIRIKLKIGEILDLIGRWDEAEQVFLSCINESHDLKSKGLLLSSYIGYSRIQIDKTSLEKARESLHKAKRIAEDLKVIKEMAEIEKCMGNISILKGEYDDAKKSFEKCKELSEETGDEYGIGRAIGNLGLVYYNQGYFHEAIKYHKEAEKIYKKLGDRQKIATAYINMGVVYAEQGKHKKALEYYKLSRDINEELGNKSVLSDLLYNTGIIYLNIGQYDKALEFCMHAVHIAKETGARQSLAELSNFRGKILYIQENYPEAMQYFEEYKKFSEEIGDKHGIGIAACNMGLIKSRQGKYNEAIEYYNLFRQMSEEIGYGRGMRYALENIGTTQFYLGSTDEAIESFQLSIDVSKRYGDKPGIAINLGNIGTAYFNIKKYDLALSYINKAIKLWRKEKIRNNELIEILLFKSKLMLILCKTRLAERYNEEAQAICRELNNSELLVRTEVQKLLIKAKSDKGSAVRSLEALLNESLSDEQKADIYFELFLLSGSDDHKKNAKALFTKIYEKKPHHKIKKTLEQLGN